MGPPQAEEMIRDAYTMGADEGVILSDRKFAGADVLATSYALAQGIQVIGGADLIICGRQTTDGDTAQVGPALYSAVLYFFFQLASVSVMYQHMEDVTDENRSTKQRSGCLYATSVQWNFPFWDFLQLPMLVSLHLHLYRCLYWFRTELVPEF